MQIPVISRLLRSKGNGFWSRPYSDRGRKGRWRAGTHGDDAIRVNTSVCSVSACDDVVGPGLCFWDAIVSTLRYDRYSLAAATVYRAVNRSASWRRNSNHPVEAPGRETRH